MRQCTGKYLSGHWLKLGLQLQIGVLMPQHVIDACSWMAVVKVQAYTNDDLKLFGSVC